MDYLKRIIEKRVKEFPDSKEYSGVNLVFSGMVDSFEFLELLMFLEEAFGISFNFEEVNLVSLSEIDNLVETIKNLIDSK